MNNRKAQLDEAIESSSAATKKLRERVARSEEESEAVSKHMQRVLNDLIEPLTSQKYEFLRANDPEAEDKVVESDEESDDLPLSQREYVFMAGETGVYAWEYLGDEWSEWIYKLHSLPAHAQPAGIATPLHSWQLTAVSKMIMLAESTLGGGILGDEMGLGKTLETIAICHELRDKRGAFNLIITTKSCMQQWKDELYWNFEPASRPKVKLLADPNISANELLDEGFEYVICTYQFVRSRYETLQKARDDFGKPPSDSSSVTGNDAGPHRRQVLPTRPRPVASLHSSVYRQMELPIRCLILDEGHLIKNENSQTYDAVDAIFARYVFTLTGTLFANRWADAYGPVSLLKGHPFQTRDDFQKAFARQVGNSTISTPSQSKENRFVKFLQGLMVARPAELLSLEELDIKDSTFWIADLEVVATVAYLVKLMREALITIGVPSLGQAAASKHSPRRAVFLATMAQQLVAHEAMLGKRDLQRIEELKKEAVKHIEAFKEAWEDMSQESGTLYQDVVEHMSKFWKPKKEPAAGDGSNEARDESLDEPSSAVDPDGAIEPEPDEEANDSDNYADDDEGSDDAVPAINEHELAKIDPLARKKFLEKIRMLPYNKLCSPRVSAMLKQIKRILTEYPGEKILVFSKFLKFLDIAAEALKECVPTLPILRFDGSVDDHTRKARISEFTQYDGSIVTLITAGSGGVGLNLTTASHVILVEPWWRESDELQAFARVYRLGQTRKVHVWKLFGEDAMIDGVLRELSKRKAEVNDRIMNQLRRKDEEVPVIPKQYKYWGGEA